MTEQAPTDPAKTDDLTDAVADGDEPDDPWHDQIDEVADDFGSPDVIALVAFVLAIASFLGFGLMAGSTYITPLANFAEEDNGNRVVLGIVLGAVLALIPAILGWRSSARVLDSDASWVRPVARAAVVLALSSAVLHLVVAVITAAHDGPTGFTRL